MASMPTTQTRPTTELLAPAGDWESLRAAVAAGADAVYFGLPRFSARARATNFRPEELADVMEFLRRRGTRGYLAFNTLIFPDELEAAAGMVELAAGAGCDALIVQDPGLARLARRMVPTLAIHASTQMSLAEPRGIELARRELGISRVILPRELSLEQIRAVAAEASVELEVFVHGALCISYSGQCLASLALGGRSGNRGECAQPCRLPYELLGTRGEGRGAGAGTTVSDEASSTRPSPPAPRPYPLSPKDLSAWELVPELVGLGVRGLKIEGRLKGPGYVRTATAFYRRALDAALEDRAFAPSADDLAALAQGFSRGFTRGHLGGTDHRELVEGLSPRPRGVRVGTVAGRTEGGVLVTLEDEIRPGDGLVFVPENPGGNEFGGRVFGVRPRPRPSGEPPLVELTFGREADPSAVEPGSAVWKTDDPALEKRQAREHAAAAVERRAPLAVKAVARIGGELRLVFRDERGHAVEIVWPGPLSRAEKHPLNEKLLGEQLGRLGDTPFELAAVDAAGVEPAMVPKSVLNDLRRQAVAKLVELRTASARHRIAEPQALAALRPISSASSPAPRPPPPVLAVLARTWVQLEAVLTWQPPAGLPRPGLVYFEPAEVDALAAAVKAMRSAGMRAGLAGLQVVEPGEDALLAALAEAGPDAVLVRNLATLEFFRGRVGAAPAIELVGDFPLNAANGLSAAWLANLGLARITQIGRAHV